MLSAGSAGQVNWPLLALLIAVAVSLSTAMLGGIFKPRRILGPPRLSPGEPPRVLLGITGFGLAAWSGTLFVAMFCLAPSAQSRPTTAPVEFSDAQKIVIDASAQVVVFAVLIAATVTLRPAGMKMLGANPARIPRGLAGGILGTIVVLPLMVLVDGAAEWWWKFQKMDHPQAHDMLLILHRHPQPWLEASIVVSAGLLAPLAEETFFRGYVQTFLRYSIRRPWLAVLLTAELFALVHPAWTQPQILFLGICLGYVYERTGNLWVCIVMHALFNLTSIAYFWHSQMGHG
jgi:membrane protease YdiL (CAAX protease family)